MHYDSIQIQIFKDVQHNRTLKNLHFFGRGVKIL